VTYLPGKLACCLTPRFVRPLECSLFYWPKRRYGQFFAPGTAEHDTWPTSPFRLPFSSAQRARSILGDGSTHIEERMNRKSEEI